MVSIENVSGHCVNHIRTVPGSQTLRSIGRRLCWAAEMMPGLALAYRLHTRMADAEACQTIRSALSRPSDFRRCRRVTLRRWLRTRHTAYPLWSRLPLSRTRWEDRTRPAGVETYPLVGDPSCLDQRVDLSQ